MTGHARAAQQHDLWAAGERDELRRAVAAGVVASRPHRLSGRGIVGHERPAVGAAGADDHPARRARAATGSGPRRAPGRRSPATTWWDQSLRPVRSSRAFKMPVAPCAKTRPSADGGGGARPDAGDHRVVACLVGVAPARPAGGELVGHDQLFGAALLLGDGEAVHDRRTTTSRRRWAAATRSFGGRAVQSRASRRPGTVRVAVGSEELRPGRPRRSQVFFGRALEVRASAGWRGAGGGVRTSRAGGRRGGEIGSGGGRGLPARRGRGRGNRVDGRGLREGRGLRLGPA